jgi:hypothetical protein
MPSAGSSRRRKRMSPSASAPCANKPRGMRRPGPRHAHKPPTPMLEPLPIAMRRNRPSESSSRPSVSSNASSGSNCRLRSWNNNAAWAKSRLASAPCANKRNATRRTRASSRLHKGSSICNSSNNSAPSRISSVRPRHKPTPRSSNNDSNSSRRNATPHNAAGKPLRTNPPPRRRTPPIHAARAARVGSAATANNKKTITGTFFFGECGALQQAGGRGAGFAGQNKPHPCPGSLRVACSPSRGRRLGPAKPYPRPRCLNPLNS